MTIGFPGERVRSKDEPCALCGSNEGLKLSHLIPKFVFQHASTRSPTGFLRTNLTPNKRSQDGPKEYLLCGSCERLFSNWERCFARTFKKNYTSTGSNFVYQKEDALAVLSILWRILANIRGHTELNHLTLGSDYIRTDAAFERWKAVIFGNSSNPGPFRIYWFWPDNFISGPSSINRYTFHCCDFDLLASFTRSFVVVHLPGCFLIGVLEDHDRAEFRGLDLSFSGGRYLRSEQKSAPMWLKDYIEQKMTTRESALSEISDIQTAKINETVLRDPEKAIRSPLFRSILFDRRIDRLE